jgi:hypothetical protein
MRRHMIGITLILLGMVFVASCGIGATSLTPSQLQAFLAEKNIQPVAVEENVGGDVTVILYKEADKMGCYTAFARNGIEAVHSWDSFLNLRRDAVKPVSFIYNSVFEYDIVCLAINDNTLRSKASTVKIFFPDNSEIDAPVKNGGDMIVYQNFGRRNEVFGTNIIIIIYDDRQQEIIRSPFE